MPDLKPNDRIILWGKYYTFLNYDGKFMRTRNEDGLLELIHILLWSQVKKV